MSLLTLVFVVGKEFSGFQAISVTIYKGKCSFCQTFPQKSVKSTKQMICFPLNTEEEGKWEISTEEIQ